MPEICRFFGIIITLNFADHAPPHFHARYGEYKAIVSIKDLRVLEGRLPPRVLGFVMEWASLRQKALLTNWNLVAKNQMPNRIAPLE